MVRTADVVFLNFTRCKQASIGMTAELTTAYLNGKHIVTVLPEENPNRHAFIIQMSGTIFINEDDAIEYLINLGKSI